MSPLNIKSPRTPKVNKGGDLMSPSAESGFEEGQSMQQYKNEIEQAEFRIYAHKIAR